MSKYDLIAFDMDGTLLSSSKQILPESLDAIHRAALAGKTVALSTGRNPAELVMFREELREVPFIICDSGARVCAWHRGETLYARAIPEETVRTVLELTAGAGIMVQLLSDESVVQADRIPHMAEYNMAVYQPMYEQYATGVEDIAGYYAARPFPVYKLNLHCRSHEEREHYRQLVAPLGLQLVFSEHTSLECSARGVSKGSGLRQLCASLGIPVERSIAVGDADNDLDILRTAGLAVAMGNANERVRAIADVIVGDNNHGGCAQAIDQFLL